MLLQCVNADEDECTVENALLLEHFNLYSCPVALCVAVRGHFACIRIAASLDHANCFRAANSVVYVCGPDAL